MCKSIFLNQMYVNPEVTGNVHFAMGVFFLQTSTWFPWQFVHSINIPSGNAWISVSHIIVFLCHYQFQFILVCKVASYSAIFRGRCCCGCHSRYQSLAKTLPLAEVAPKKLPQNFILAKFHYYNVDEQFLLKWMRIAISFSLTMHEPPEKV